jgi:hypothetical protein
MPHIASLRIARPFRRLDLKIANRTAKIEMYKANGPPAATVYCPTLVPLHDAQTDLARFALDGG